VDRIIAGPTPAVAICNECVGMCSEIIAEERAGDHPPDSAA
jgi:ATP-dependent protease Clp ATPase subunit